MSGAGKRAAGTVWQLFAQQRREMSVGLTLPSSKSLWDVMKREHLEKHNARQIKDIWLEFHADPGKGRTADVVPAAQYVAMAATASQNPQFVLPVFRGPNALENFFVQCQLPLVLFTSVEEYKRHGSSAMPHLVLTHYTELAEDKGVVLLRGDIVNSGSFNQFEAQCIVRLFYDFYTQSQKRHFLHAFNHRQSEFDLKRMLDSLMHDTSQLPRD